MHICKSSSQFLYKNRVSYQKNTAISFIRRASLTIECALVLPLFFMGMVALISVMGSVGLLVSESLTLSNSARQAAMAAGEAYAAAGLDSSDIWIDIPETKAYAFPLKPFPLPNVKVAVRARVYPWVGAAPFFKLEDSGEDHSSGMVYLTENQSVYHTHDDCSHLQLSVTCVPQSEVASLRNADGSRYKKCSGFPADYDGPVYLTEQGEYYYPSPDYPGLTRHVRMVRESEACSLPLCSRCRAKDGAA